jgi:hypothetical protein
MGNGCLKSVSFARTVDCLDLLLSLSDRVSTNRKSKLKDRGRGLGDEKEIFLRGLQASIKAYES